MKAFIENNLMPDEKIIKQGFVHWVVFCVPASFAYLILSMGGEPRITMIYLLSWGVFFCLVVFALIVRLTTEMAITNQRVVVKRGFISRNVTENYHDKIDGIVCNQDILGRILNYGDLLITSAGVVSKISLVDKPFEFRKKMLEVTTQINKKQRLK